MKIATWNVNSLKVRLPHVLQWLETHDIDILALQETKLLDENFPQTEFTNLGYHIAFSGQKTYNGVAIISKHPIENTVLAIPEFDDPQKRVLAATIQGLRIINVYVPNGSEVGSDKYDYKLTWLTKLTAWMQQEKTKHKQLLMLGDFNIAPADVDVHNPAAWEGKVLCSAPERKALAKLMDLDLVDIFRLFEQPEKSYSWWDYRNLGFRRNHGLRIDLLLASSELARKCTFCAIDKEPRTWQRPSDHAPVWADFSKK